MKGNIKQKGSSLKHWSWDFKFCKIISSVLCKWFLFGILKPVSILHSFVGIPFLGLLNLFTFLMFQEQCVWILNSPSSSKVSSSLVRAVHFHVSSYSCSYSQQQGGVTAVQLQTEAQVASASGQQVQTLQVVVISLIVFVSTAWLSPSPHI